MFKILLILLPLALSCSSFKKLKLEPAKIKKNDLSISWLKNLDPVHETGNLPISFASPLLIENMLFVGDLAGHMNAFDLESGREMWRTDDKEAINGKGTRFNNWILYGTLYGRLFARDFLTGELIYSADLGAPIESPPVIYDGKLFIHLRNHQIMSLDAKTGKILWSYKRSVPYTTTLQNVARPLILKNQVIVGFADGYLTSLSFDEGILNWEQKLSSARKFLDVDIEPVLFNGVLVTGSAAGDLYFINPSSGFIVRTLPYTISSKPLVMGDTLVIGTSDGEMVRLDSHGNELAKVVIEAGKGISNIIAFKEKLIATTTGKNIYAVYPKGFKVLDKLNLGSSVSAVFGDVEFNKSRFAFMSSRSRLYVFK